MAKGYREASLWHLKKEVEAMDRKELLQEKKKHKEEKYGMVYLTDYNTKHWKK